MLKKLLSAKDKSEARPKCERHQEKAIKLFCETCDQPICRDCTVKDHRDHDYEIIKNVFPAKKEFIMEFVRKAEAKIPALTSAIESVEERERQVQENLKVVREEIDGFINKHIASLEQKRKGLMEELEELSLTPRTRLREQRQALSESLDRVQTSVRLANKDVDRDEAEVLLNKYKIIHQMIDVCEVNTPLVPPDAIFYKLEGRPLFDDEAVGNMAKISESGEFVLSMLGGEPGVIYTTRAEQKCNFQITPRNSNETANDREDVVEVHINCACSGQVESSSVESHLDGTYTFDYCPRVKGVYHVGIYINGKRSCGSPVTWKVEPPFKISSRFSGLASKALKNSAIGRAMFAEREHTDPSECLFEGGQHSWKARCQLVESTNAKHQIGAIHSGGSHESYWEEGRLLSKALNGDNYSRVASSVRSLEENDVLVCYLNIEKNQLILYNERTKESDTLLNVKAPVFPLIRPTNTSKFKVNVS